MNHFDVLCGTFKTNLLFTTVYGFQFWGHENLPFFGLDTVDGFDSWGHAKFMKESVKPESQFGIYIPEEAFVWGAKARNMNVVGPPKTLHIRGHNGCVLVVLHFWDWAWLLVWSLLILQHGFDRSTWAVRRRFLKLRNNRKKKGKKETKNT